MNARAPRPPTDRGWSRRRARRSQRRICRASATVRSRPSRQPASWAAISPISSGRQPRVVLDDAVDFFDRLALRPQLDRAKLQPFHENIGRSRTRTPPISIQCTLMAKKPISVLRARAGIDRRVHHRVVEMLALHGGVIADDDVAMVQPLAAVDFRARRAPPCRPNRRRKAACRRCIARQMAVGADQADGEIVIFVDIGAERGALDVGVDLIGDRDERRGESPQA